jgi:hypothetical protein
MEYLRSATNAMRKDFMATILVDLSDAFYTPVWKTGNNTVFPLVGEWAAGRAASNFCPKQISYTLGGILMKLHTNVHHYEKPCRAHEPDL